MFFISFTFVVFLLASVLVYYLCPKEKRWIVLLIASYIFYLSGGIDTLGNLLFTTYTTFLAGTILEKLNSKLEKTKDKGAAESLKKEKKWVVALCMIFNFGMLFVLKYLGFTVSIIAPLLAKFGLSLQPDDFSFILPLGVSFYIFQSTGYVIDVYRKKYPAQKNFAKYALFTSFFPQMVQGPISRYDQLSEELFTPRTLDFDNIRNGIQRLMWGFFKKMVIADRAAVLVGTFFSDYDSYGGAVTAFSIIMYCIDLYCDFSGGIDITIGAAELFGVRLTENFKRPIFSESLAEYWRRWHISLGSWMRDYVFYPISLSKTFAKIGKFARAKIGGKLGKVLPTSIATFIVYLIIGIWHSASYRYIAYGFWNGGIITLSLLLAGVYSDVKKKLHINSDSSWWHLFGMIRTWFIVFLGRYITRAPRFLVGIHLIGKTFTPSTFALSDLWNGTILGMGLTSGDLIIVAVSTLVMLLMEYYEEKHGSVREALSKKGAFVQWMAMLIPMLAILLFGIMRGSYISSEFIYKQY